MAFNFNFHILFFARVDGHKLKKNNCKGLMLLFFAKYQRIYDNIYQAHIFSVLWFQTSSLCLCSAKNNNTDLLKNSLYMHYLIPIPLNNLFFSLKKIFVCTSLSMKVIFFGKKLKKKVFWKKIEGMKVGQKLKLQIDLPSFTNESIGKINFQSMILYKILQVGAIHQNYLEYILLCTILV